MLPPKKKRHLTYVTIGIFFLLQGVEYAVILPTLWLYLEKKFDGHAYMLGIILSSFSLAGLISSPVMGRWSDRTRNTKGILLVANVIQFIGSVMYFMGISEWFLVAARFVAGLGSGVGSALFADIARVTSTEERTAVMSVFMAVRQIGLLLGPGCNLFLRHLNFHIGPYIVDKYTSPGIFMAVLWVLHEILTIFMYWNLPKLKLEETVIKQQQETITQSSHSRLFAASRIPNMESPLVQPSAAFNAIGQVPANHAASHHQPRSSSPCIHSRGQHQPAMSDLDDDPAYLTSSNEIIESAERFMGHGNRRNRQSQRDSLMNSDTHENTYSNYGATTRHSYDTSSSSSLGDSFRHMDGSDQDNVQQTVLEAPPISEDNKSTESRKSLSQKITLNFLYNEFGREEVIALLFTGFVAFFNQVGIETLFTPLSQQLLDWGELENSILFCVAGAEVIGVFFLVRVLSRHMGDRWLILMGFVGLSATIAVSTWFIPQAKPDHYKSNFAGLAILVFFDVLSLPFLAVSSASLFSKITRKETQGFAQGIRRMFIGMGTILGPLWAGAMLDRLLINFIVMLVICTIALLMLLMSFRHLREEGSDTVGKTTKKTPDDSGAPNAVVVQPWEEADEEEQRPLLPH